jgi:hypothetical protein
VHPCIIWSCLPKIRRVRPSRPAPSSADRCGHRAGVPTSGTLDRKPCEPVDCQRAAERLAGSPYVGGTSASVARRLCAACVPPLPSFLTRTPSSVRRQSTGQYEATTSNEHVGSTVAGRLYHEVSKVGRECARTRSHDDPSETGGQDRAPGASFWPNSLLCGT